jgi:outer membrane protein
MIRIPKIVCCFSLIVAALRAESYDLQEAVAKALDRYPAVTASAEQMAAAAAAIQLAKTSFLPRVDFSAQLNRATHNNVFGMLLPPAGVPGISGPVLGTNSLASVWGSAVGFQVSWEPFDFGLRRAGVGLAEASRKSAEAALIRTRFDVARAAADAFLTLVAAQQLAVSAEAGVQRAEVLQKTVAALVQAQLRPGADLSRARAEAAVAEAQLIQARQAVAVAKAALSQFVGSPPEGIATRHQRLLELPPPAAPAAIAEAHPLLAQREAVLQEAQASRRVLERAYYPKFAVTGTTYARGTGAMTDGRRLGGLSGVGPNIHNWGVGFSVVFPLLDWPGLKARREAADHQERAESARREQARQDLSSALARAQAELDSAWRMAQNTPVRLEAARDAERQAVARYKAGLGVLLEVAEAQRLVTQSEIDDSIAKLNVWRAMLGVAAAQGDLEHFLKQAGR